MRGCVCRQGLILQPPFGNPGIGPDVDDVLDTGPTVPETIAPISGPNWPALKVRPMAFGSECRKSAIYGKATPETVKSSPFGKVTRNERLQSDTGKR